MLGRTHGMWAEPTSFGLKLANWAFELSRAHHRLRLARDEVAVGKLSGVVGTYSHGPPEIEEYVCTRLGLTVEPAATQVVGRDRYAQFVVALAGVAGSLERMATEIRHLQRSEVAEVREPFRRGQKGSSAMPHKRNPIMAERITGLARLIRGYALVAMENVALWHERDISHSSAERVTLPDACLALDYMLARFRSLVKDMEVDEARMRANLEATGGLVYSQSVLLAMVEEGMTRDEAYRIVQENASAARDTGTHLQERLAIDSRVRLSAERLKQCFDPDRFLANSGVIFERLQQLEL
jgi:adenylosuccinate lyase